MVGWRITVSLTKFKKILLVYHFPEEFFIADLYFLKVLKVEGRPVLLFRIIYKEYMYDFIQAYSFLFFDVASRTYYKSELKEEGTFDNIRDDNGLMQGNHLYYWN